MFVPASTMPYYTMPYYTMQLQLTIMVAQLKKEVAQVCCAQHSVLLRYKHMLKKSLVKFSVCFKVAGSSEAMASSCIISWGSRACPPCLICIKKKAQGQLDYSSTSSVYSPTPNFWCLSCKHPWALARDTIVCMQLYVCLSFEILTVRDSLLQGFRIKGGKHHTIQERVTLIFQSRAT